MLDCVDNPEREVSREAVKVLAIGALFYNGAPALSSLSKCLEHPSSFRRQSAVTGVAFAARAGDVRAIDALLARLMDYPRGFTRILFLFPQRLPFWVSFLPVPK